MLHACATALACKPVRALQGAVPQTVQMYGKGVAGNSGCMQPACETVLA